MPIDEAVRVTEQLLGPYNGEEQAKWGWVVHEARMSRANVDLAECPNPNAGKKKRTHVPRELEAQGPISAVPLSAIGPDLGGVGGRSCAGMDATDRPLKKGSRTPVAQPEMSSLMSSLSTALQVALGASVGAAEWWQARSV